MALTYKTYDSVDMRLVSTPRAQKIAVVKTVLVGREEWPRVTTQDSGEMNPSGGHRHRWRWPAMLAGVPVFLEGLSGAGQLAVPSLGRSVERFAGRRRASQWHGRMQELQHALERFAARPADEKRHCWLKAKTKAPAMPKRRMQC